MTSERSAYADRGVVSKIVAIRIAGVTRRARRVTAVDFLEAADVGDGNVHRVILTEAILRADTGPRTLGRVAVGVGRYGRGRRHGAESRLRLLGVGQLYVE